MDSTMTGVLLAIMALYVVLVVWVRRPSRPTMVVTCPHTGRLASVELDDVGSGAPPAVAYCPLWPLDGCKRGCVAKRHAA